MPIAVALIVLLVQRIHLPAFLAIMATVVVYGIAADMTFQSIGKAFGLGFTNALEQVGLLVVAGALGELHLPHGAVVWRGLLITALPATALALFAQIWVQQRITAARAAILFTLEVPFAALFGIVLQGDSLGTWGWLGGALIAVAIVIVEPAATQWLRSASGRRAARPRRPARSSRPSAGP